MQSQIVPITSIKENENNPRIIRHEKFLKLVQSVKDFPEMLNLRPIVVNKEMVIIGGNMRYNACIEAGMTEIPIVIADLTPEQEREFVIKDNVSGGEWDYAELKAEWGELSLGDWGLDNWENNTIQFNPNVNPSATASMVTDEDVQKQSEKLENRYNGQEGVKKSIICPHCLESFEID